MVIKCVKAEDAQTEKNVFYFIKQMEKKNLKLKPGQVQWT
jgi:hypothetical protein